MKENEVLVIIIYIIMSVIVFYIWARITKEDMFGMLFAGLWLATVPIFILLGIMKLMLMGIERIFGKIKID